MNDGVIYFKREWLNAPDFCGGANVRARVTRWHAGKNNDEPRTDFELEISDCNRSIHLALGVYGENEKVNSIEKLNTLINVLTDMRQLLIDSPISKEPDYSTEMELVANGRENL